MGAPARRAQGGVSDEDQTTAAGLICGVGVHLTVCGVV